jgi:hypothetical protein
MASNACAQLQCIPRAKDLAPPTYKNFLLALRSLDSSFAEASILQPDDMGDWQAAVYLLTGCMPIWREVGDDVMGERSLVPVTIRTDDLELQGWTDDECAAMQWAAHFWDPLSNPVEFPEKFERPLFDRWIVALHLRRGIVPI